MRFETLGVFNTCLFYCLIITPTTSAWTITPHQADTHLQNIWESDMLVENGRRCKLKSAVWRRVLVEGLSQFFLFLLPIYFLSYKTRAPRACSSSKQRRNYQPRQFKWRFKWRWPLLRFRWKHARRRNAAGRRPSARQHHFWQYRYSTCLSWSKWAFNFDFDADSSAQSSPEKPLRGWNIQRFFVRRWSRKDNKTRAVLVSSFAKRVEERIRWRRREWRSWRFFCYCSVSKSLWNIFEYSF